MNTYPDAYIEHWGGVFVVLDLFNWRGIRFETFLLDPQAILDAIEKSPRMEPLLPKQAAVMHRDIEESLLPEGAQLRGSVYMLPLKHHAYTVSLTHHHNRRAAT